MSKENFNSAAQGFNSLLDLEPEVELMADDSRNIEWEEWCKSVEGNREPDPDMQDYDEWLTSLYERE